MYVYQFPVRTHKLHFFSCLVLFCIERIWTKLQITRYWRRITWNLREELPPTPQGRRCVPSSWKLRGWRLQLDHTSGEGQALTLKANTECASLCVCTCVCAYTCMCGCIWNTIQEGAHVCSACWLLNFLKLQFPRPTRQLGWEHMVTNTVWFMIHRNYMFFFFYLYHRTKVYRILCTFFYTNFCELRPFYILVIFKNK